jgi:hypothetical protein
MYVCVEKFYGDGTFDTSQLFECFKESESAIKIRNNASTGRESKRKRREVRD